MTKSITTSVRILFASFALTLLAYAGLDAALTHEAGTIGLAACGDAANPCELAPLTVTAPTATRLVEMPAVPAAPAEPAPLAES